MSDKPTRILLVEDNPGDARLIQEMLAEIQASQYELSLANQLSAGIELLSREHFDVVMLDLGLPDSQGLDTLDKMHNQELAIPIVVLTGLDDKLFGAESIRHGAQDYLVKGKVSGRTFERVIRYSIERKELEEALRESTRRLKEAQSLGKIGNWEFDLATKKIEWSDEIYELYERDKALGPPSAEEEAGYYPPEEARKTREFTRLAIEKGEKFNYDLTAVLPSGKTVFFTASMHPVKDTTGQVIKLFGTVQDITERKKMEEQMLRSSKLASIGELAAGVAHEINNPLTTIMGYAQLLADRKDIPEDAREDLDKIVQQSRRTAKVVQNLLRFARQYQAEKIPVNINELISRTLELRGYELSTSNIKMTTKLAENLPPIMADYNQIQQVILNIMLNAEQAITEAGHGGKVIIKTSLANGYLHICIGDNGPGIAPEHISKVFDPFFTTKEVGKGSGLGLAICHGIITEHGGSISVESTPGKGSKFVIELPLATEEQSVTEKIATEEKKQGSSTGATGSILVIDDEPLIQNLLIRALSQTGYKVEAVSSGKKALARLATKAYDILLCDIKMPEMGGNELYAILKKDYPHLADRVVFITGDTVTEDTNSFLLTTGRPHLSKPFDYRKLADSIESVLNKR